MSKFYKILAKGRKACHGGEFTYPYRKWTPRIENVRECKRGYHVCDENNVAVWFYADEAPIEIWECDVRGEVPSSDGKKYVCESIRLTRKVGSYSETDCRLLAIQFAEDCLPEFEKHHPNDSRPRDCINTARGFILGTATLDELSAAWSAAWSAAESAAESAAWSAARSAAWSAAESAAESAAWSAAESAAWSAARSVAWSAARSAARSKYSAWIIERRGL